MTKKYIRNKTPNTNKTCYHTDPDCCQLVSCREVTDNEIEYHDLHLCAFCDPEQQPRSNSVDRSYLQALKEAANE